MSTQKSLLQILPLVIILFGFIGYNIMSAAWTPAPSAPPANNTEAPINVSSTTQVKAGNLGINIAAAIIEMRSDRYCDVLGQNCFHPSDVSSSAGRQWIDYGGSAERKFATVYQNTDTLDRPIYIRLTNNIEDNGGTIYYKTNAQGAAWQVIGTAPASPGAPFNLLVPPGHFYTIDTNYNAGCPGSTGSARAALGCNTYISQAPNGNVSWYEYQVPPLGYVPPPPGI